MTERTKEQEEYDRNFNFVSNAQSTGNIAGLLGNIALSLFRIMQAQEQLVQIAMLDVEQAVENEVQQRAETMAQEIVADKTKRSFIGKK